MSHRSAGLIFELGIGSRVLVAGVSWQGRATTALRTRQLTCGRGVAAGIDPAPDESTGSNWNCLKLVFKTRWKEIIFIVRGNTRQPEGLFQKKLPVEEH